MKLINKDKLLFGLPIEVENMGTIYQPTLKTFIEKNFDIQKFIRAFNIKADLAFEGNDGKLKDFDVFLYQLSLKLPEDKLLITELMESLKILYKTDKVDLVMLNKEDINSICISIEVIENNKPKVYYINRDNYNNFANIVLILFDLGNNTMDVVLNEELSEIDRKIAQRKREFEKKKAERERKLKEETGNEKEEITIYDLVNYIIHADNSQFNYENILELTIYQIKNTFNLYRQKENYKLFMDYKTSGQFKIDDDVSHWFFNN